MRVTQNMLAEGFMRNLSQNLRRLGNRQDMFSSTKKIRRPSDDPVGAALAMRLRRQLSGIEQYKSNARDALTWLKNSETSLANSGDIIHRIKELTIQAANGTMTSEDRTKVLNEVQELKEQLLHEVNSAYVDNHLFSGFSIDNPPFEKHEIDGKIVIRPNEKMLKPTEVKIVETQGKGIVSPDQFDVAGIGTNIKPGTYKIEVSNYIEGETATITLLDEEDNVIATGDVNVNEDGQTVGSGENKITLNLKNTNITGNGTTEIKITEGTMEYNLGKSQSIPVNLIGPEVFKGIFENIEELEDALGDPSKADKISGDILGKVSGDLNQMLKYRAQIGARVNRLEATVDRLDYNRVDYTELLSQTEDADMAEVIMELKMEESVYRASLAVGARIIQPTLTDFLR